jgi:hypothetical protein
MWRVPLLIHSPERLSFGHRTLVEFRIPGGRMNIPTQRYEIVLIEASNFY